MKEHDYKKILKQSGMIREYLDSIEEIARRASSEQSVVARPERFESENPALARPVSLTEIVSFVEGMMHDYKTDRASGRFEQGVVAACETILQQLGKLDQGPIAKSPSKGSQNAIELFERCL